MSRSRTVPRRVLHLGELNTTQVEQWQRTIEVVEESGQASQRRLFTDREGQAPAAEIVAEVEAKPGEQGRVWVFDRGIVSEANLALLQERGTSYLVGTSRHRLRESEQELLQGDWESVAGRPDVKVQLVRREAEVDVLVRSEDRALKELAMRRRELRGLLSKELQALRKAIRLERVRKASILRRRLGRSRRPG